MKVLLVWVRPLGVEKLVVGPCSLNALPYPAGLFWGMREAQAYDVAVSCADALEALLYDVNQSALKSFKEAREDLLILHKLRVSGSLRRFFSTTNAIESLNYIAEEDLRRVKKWSDSAHFQRWLATSCLHGEKRMHRVQGYKGLPALEAALGNLCTHDRAEKLDRDERIA